jgi:catechol 2,3-dioxygenase-like lactoylglutathione lyase family enzyme
MTPRGVMETVLYVDDLDAAERFYTEVLGMEVIARDRRRHVFFRCGRGVFLVFNPAVTRTSTAHAAGIAVPLHGATGPGHMAFAAHEAELPAWRERLRAAGVAIETEIAWPQGGHSVYFRDPAGNSVELVTPAVWAMDEEPRTK